MIILQAMNVLGTPVPRVLAWSSDANENPVGVEYIIMEKVAGVQLDRVWPTTHIKERFEVVTAISKFQKAWMSATFSKYGSLYYSRDLEGLEEGCSYVRDDGAEVHDARREFFDDGRVAVDFDRGPCKAIYSLHSDLRVNPLARRLSRGKYLCQSGEAV